jgi:hypothetical protein
MACPHNSGCVSLRLFYMTCYSRRACGSNTYIPEYGTAMSHNQYIIYQWYYLNSLCVMYNYLFPGMAFYITRTTVLNIDVPKWRYRCNNRLQSPQIPTQVSVTRIDWENQPHCWNGACSWIVKCEYVAEVLGQFWLGLQLLDLEIFTVNDIRTNLSICGNPNIIRYWNWCSFDRRTWRKSWDITKLVDIH